MVFDGGEIRGLFYLGLLKADKIMVKRNTHSHRTLQTIFDDLSDR